MDGGPIVVFVSCELKPLSVGVEGGLPLFQSQGNVAKFQLAGVESHVGC